MKTFPRYKQPGCPVQLQSAILLLSFLFVLSCNSSSPESPSLSANSTPSPSPEAELSNLSIDTDTPIADAKNENLDPIGGSTEVPNDAITLQLSEEKAPNNRCFEVTLKIELAPTEPPPTPWPDAKVSFNLFQVELFESPENCSGAENALTETVIASGASSKILYAHVQAGKFVPNLAAIDASADGFEILPLFIEVDQSTASDSLGENKTNFFWCPTGADSTRCDWNDPQNWYQDAQHTTRSRRIPQAQDKIEISPDGGVFTHGPQRGMIFQAYSGRAPSDNVGASTQRIFVTEGGSLSVTGGNWGGSTLGPSSNIVFSGSSVHFGIVRGQAIFVDSAKNQGIVTGESGSSTP